jgi:hypothetical protein
MKKFLLGLCVLLAAVSAQAKQELQGLREFDVVIEGLSQSSIACGINDSLINTALRFVLQQSKIRVNRQATSFIYVAVATIPPWQGSCRFSVRLEVHTPIIVRGSGVPGWGAVWSGSAIYSDAVHAIPKTLTEAVESLSKRFVVDWSSVNQ